MSDLALCIFRQRDDVCIHLLLLYAYFIAKPRPERRAVPRHLLKRKQTSSSEVDPLIWVVVGVLTLS